MVQVLEPAIDINGKLKIVIRCVVGKKNWSNIQSDIKKEMEQYSSDIEKEME